MENRQKLVCGLGFLTFVATSFAAGVWYGTRSSTFVLTRPPEESQTRDSSSGQNQESDENEEKSSS